jgi:membrane protein implicated in regulation of membrane protease activity
MTIPTVVLLWLILGIILVLLEIIIPGGIVSFLGISALIVAACLYAGFISGLLEALTLWFISSLVLLFGLRGLVQKFMPSEITKSNTSEDVDAYNKIVPVNKTIPAAGMGRIYFRGTYWDAKNYHQDKPLEKGSKVRIIFRENLTWVVEEENRDSKLGPAE